MFEQVCVASEHYLAKRGVPREPDGLRDHDCIIYTLLPSGSTWHFRNIDVQVSGRLRINSPEAVREAVGTGLGVGHGSQWLFEEGLKAGNLRLLLGEHAEPVSIQILYVANRLLAKRHRVHGLHRAGISPEPALNAGAAK